MFLPRFRKIRFILNTTAGVVLTVLFVSSLISSALLVNNTTRQYVLDSLAGVDFGAGVSQTSGEYQDYKAGKTKIPSASDSKKDKQTTKEKQTEKDKQIQTGGLQQSSGGKQTGSSSTSSGGSGSGSSINPSSSQWNVPSNPNNLPAPSQSSSGSQGSQNKQPSPQKPGATVESCGSGISTSACFCTTTNCYWNDSKGNTHSVQKGTEQHQNLITAITQGGIVENKSASGGSYGQIGIDSNNDGRPDYNQPLTQEVVDQIAKEAKLKQAQNAVQSYFGKTARPDLNTALQICANAMGGQCDQSLVNTITQQVNQINKINQIASSLQSWVSYQIKQGNTPDANQIYQKCLNSGGGTAGCDSISAVIDQLAAQTATIKWVNSQISSGKKPTESQINYECQKAGGGNACSSLAANIIDSINKATNKIQTQDTDEGKQQFMQQANLAEARTKVLTGQITSYEEAKKISPDYTESQFNLDRQKYHQAVKDSLANNFPQSQAENKTAITGTYGTYGQKAPKIQTQVNNVPSQSPVTTNNPNLINPNLITGGKTRGNVPTLTSEILYQQQVTTPQQLVQTGKIVGGALVTTAAVVGLVMAAPAIITGLGSGIATLATSGSLLAATASSGYLPQITNYITTLAQPSVQAGIPIIADAFIYPTQENQHIRQFVIDVAVAKVFSFGLSNTLQAVAHTGNLGSLIVRGTDFLDNADDTITAGKCIASGGGDAGACYETLINAAIGPQDMLEIPYSGISLGAKAVGKVIPSLNPPNTVSINGFNIELARHDPSNLVIAKNQITSSPVSPNINIQTNSSQTTAPNQLSPQQIAILATSQTKTPSTTPSKTTTEKTPAEITKIAQEPTKTTTEKTPIQTTEKKEESPTKQTTLEPEKSEFIAAIIEDGNRIQNTLKESSQNQYSTLALIADLAMYNHTSIPSEFKQEIEDKIPTTMANLRLTGDLDKSLKDAGVSENTSNWIKNFIENQKGKQIDFWSNTGVQEKVKEMIAKSGVEESTAKEIVESTIIGNLDKNSGLVAQTITPSQESSEKIKEELAQAEETNTKEILNNISNTSTNVIKSIIDGIAINTSGVSKNKQKTPENQLIASAINKIRQNPSEYTPTNFSDKQFYINSNNITDYQRIALQESLSEIKRWEALTKKDINTLIKNTKDIPTLSEIVELEEISSVSDLERFAQKYNIEIDLSDYRDNEISLLELKLKLIPHITDKRFEAGFDEINKKISPYFQERANERLTSEEFESLLQKSAELTDLVNSTSIKNLKLVIQARFILNYISRTKDISPETQERLTNNLSHIIAIYNIANFQDINGKSNLITQISRTINNTANLIINTTSNALTNLLKPKSAPSTDEIRAINLAINDYVNPNVRESIEKTIENINKGKENTFKTTNEVKNYIKENALSSLDYQKIEQILKDNNVPEIRAKEIIESQKSNIEKIIENEISKYKITIGPSGIAKKGLLALSDIHGNLEYLYHLLIGQETKVNIITKLGENQQVVNLGPSKITPVLSKETFVELIQNQPSEKKDGRYKIILLGDYTDQKGVSTKLADRIGLVNIIENLSKSGRADVILLLGNHDVNTIYRLVTGKSILPEINSAGYYQIDSMSGMTPEIRNKLIEFMENTQAMHFDAETGTLYIHCDGDFYTRYGKTPREINEKISLIIENFIRAPQIPANQHAMEKLIRLMTEKKTSRNLTTNPFAVRNLAEIVFNEYKVYPKMIVHGHSPVDSSAYTKSPTKKIEIRTKENKDLLIEILDLDYSFSKNKGAVFYIPPLLQQSISITKEEGAMLPLIMENTTKQIKQATSKITKTILTGLIAISIFVGALTANITDNASRIYHQVADNRPRVEQVIQLEQPKTAEETKQETKPQPPAKESTQEKQEIKKETFQFLRQNQEPWGSATVKTQKGVEVKFKNVSCGATVVANILAINGENITPPEVYQRFFPEDQDFLLADYQVTGAIKKALPNAKISQVRNTATIAEIEKYIQDENTVAVIAVNSGKQKTDEAEHITLAVATKDGKLLLQDPLYGEMSCKGGGGSFVCSPLAGGTDITYWIHSINTIKLPSPKYNFKGDLINKDTSQTSIRPATSSQDALYKAVIIDPSTFNSELANADYQQYNDQKYLPYFAQASQIIEPGNTQFSLLAQTIYQTERGSLYHKAGLGGINTGMIKKNNKYYPSRTGVIFHTLYRTDKLRPDENLLRRAAEWIGLDANSKDIRDLILNSYYHPNEEIAAKTQAFISTLILHQAKEQYGPWLAPLHYVTGNADKFINQFTSVASSREEAIEIANEVIVDLFRFVWKQPPLYGHKFENFRTLTYKAINEYGREYIAYTHEAEVVIDNKRINIRLDAIQYLMKTEGDPRLGFFERYNKLAYDQNLINEDQGSIIYQYPNKQHEAKIKSAKIMIMGDSIAQSLASGAAQNIMQKELSESSELEEFTFIGNQYYSSGGVANQAYRGVTALKLYEKIKSGEITFTSANTPDIVIIQLGVNEIASGLVSKISDIQEKFITPYHKIIDSIRQANPKAIILISPVPDTKLKNSQLNKNMNLALLEMAKYLNQDPNYPKSRVVIVNNGNPLYTDLFVSSDGVHPTQAGIISMAEEISQTITEIIDEINSQATSSVLDKNKKSIILGSGPAQWFENLSNATFYKWLPEARTKGLIPAIWNKIKRQENPDTKKPEKSKKLDKGTQMQIVEKIRNTFNLPNNLSEKGKNTEIILLDKEEFIEAILLYYEKKDIVDLENRFPENDEFNQIANALGTSIEELRNNKTIQEALIRDHLEKLEGVVLDQNIYIPKLETTIAKEEIDFIITHELIHTMANQDNGISGFQAEDGSYHILNEAATQILTLHVLYPELDEKGLIDKINSGEIKIGYTRPTIQLLTLLYTTSLSEEKVTIKDLARYYFNNDGTAPMLLAMQIKRGSLPQVAKQVDKILDLFLFNEKSWKKD